MTRQPGGPAAVAIFNPLAGTPARFDNSITEHLQERRDLDVAHWLGVRRFRRPASQAELAHLGPLAGGRDRHSITTEVTVRRGLRYRAWPQLATRAAADRMEGAGK